MPQLSIITQKGQITIPVSIRNHWGLRPHQKVVFVEKKDTVEIRPAIDFFKLRGSIRKKKKYSDKVANQAVEKYLASQHEKET